MKKKKINKLGQPAAVFAGLVVSMGITILIFAVLSFILSLAVFPEKYLFFGVILTVILSIFSGGFFCVRKQRQGGWISGVLTGGGYIIIMYIMGSIFYGDFSINKYTLLICISALLTGAIGGIIAINGLKS